MGAAASKDIAFLAAKGHAPQTAEIAVEDRLIAGAKAARYERQGKNLSVEEWKELPAQLAGEPLVLYDTASQNLLYVWPSGERSVRIVVKPDFVIVKEKRTLNEIRSAQKVSASAIDAGIKGGQYVIVRGEK